MSIRYCALIGCAGLVTIVVFAAWATLTMPDPRNVSSSTVVAARGGEILRAFLTKTGFWRFRADLDEIDPAFIDALLLIEDKRFTHHYGVDPLAAARAFGQLIISGSVLSGASTITMQLARLLEPRPRTLWSKLVEVARAIALEIKFNKREILELYLTLAPYGGNLEGIRAASLAYLGKEPRHLLSSEVALLIAIPQSPETRRPDRYPDNARRARNTILSRLSAGGAIDEMTQSEAEGDLIPSVRHAMPFSAPHIAQRLAASLEGETIQTTLEAELQMRLEHRVQRWVAGQERYVNLAIIIAEAATGAVRAHIGSSDFFDSSRAGQIDLTRAIRSPGSTLKPFIFAMAIEDGFLDPRSIVTDAPGRVASYSPENFDRSYLGETTAATALQQSLNQPAVKLLEWFGPERFLARIKHTGITPYLPKSADRPGLAVALGGIGLTLEKLVTLYTALGTDGSIRHLTYRVDADRQTPLSLVNAGPAWEVQNILSGVSQKINSSRSISYKTGTSYGYRDAWALGIVDGYVIGVWVGRPDGTPRPGHYGRNTALPLLFDAANLLPEKNAMAERSPPAGWVPMLDRPLPATLRFFPPLPLGAHTPRTSFKINLSSHETILDFSGARGISLSATGGRRPFVWMVDGRPLPSSRHRSDVWWEPRGLGFSEIVVLDADRKAARARIEIRGLNLP
jgi:penicillin-binding protein 1C